MKERILMGWSGGKDSALALHEILGGGRFEPAALLTTLTDAYDRISMHGVRRILLESQAASLGVALRKVFISQGASNDEYESRMSAALEEYRKDGIESVAFGDIFLEDLRAYREKNLAKVGMRGVFPIWKRDTRELAADFIDRGFKAFVACVDTRRLDASFAGSAFDREFLERLPPGVDPCGENGEFHSFVWDGPIFKEPVPVETGERVVRDEHFCFCDLLPAG